MTTLQVVNITDEILDFLATAPTKEQILAFKISDELQLRVSFLLDKNTEAGLTEQENAELDEIIRLDRFMSRLKVRVKKQRNGLHSR